MKQLSYSTSESNRFNMNIYRGILDEIDIRNIKKEILGKEIDILIFRIKSEKVNQVSRLNKLGFPFIQTDTLVYYQMNLENYQIKEYRNQDLEFEVLTTKELSTLNSLVEEIFVGYTNHYDSNPYLDKKDITDGYKEWVSSFLDTDEDKTCYLVKKSGVNAGFATVTNKDGVGEGILYGVVPSFSGMGIYSDIIRFTQNELKAKGCKEMKVSTQIQNYAVQKVWGKEGFYLKESFATIHVNSLLSYSKLPRKSFNLKVTEEDIMAFGKLSEDYNPVHFDDNFAKKLGFDSRIAHGLTVNSILSKYYGTEFPGKGTLFLGYQYIFLAPIYPNEEYNVEISFMKEVKKTGLYESLIKIKDGKGKICVISYNTLKKNITK